MRWPHAAKKFVVRKLNFKLFLYVTRAQNPGTPAAFPMILLQQGGLPLRDFTVFDPDGRPDTSTINIGFTLAKWKISHLSVRST